jgi:putative ABC transport system permease protein
MFALVIFTLIVISILTNVFGNAFANADEITGGWDIEAAVAPTTPIDDIEAAIAANADLNINDFEAIGGYVTAPAEVRQTGAQEQRFRGLEIQAVDDGFLAATEYEFKILSPGYNSAEEVWEAIRRDPTLAVADSSIVPSDTGGEFEEGFGTFRIEGLFIEDTSMQPIPIEVLEPRTDIDLNLTVIAILDFTTDNPSGIIVSKQAVDDALPFTIPVTTYRFRTSPGVDIPATARELEAAFLPNGMESDVLEEVIEDQVAANRAFNNLFTGFMGLGLVVGVAALGVISLRAVVERRQQIGVLRAIGYRKGMIQFGFFLESSFVALLGIVLGIALGSIISFNIVEDIQDDFQGATFSVPWLQVGLIVGIAYLFSVITTILPARQAASIHPAEALRYE